MPFLVIIVPLLALVLTGCVASKQTRPFWSQVIYAQGQVYVLSGTETRKMQTMLGHAGFEKVDWTAERQLTLRRYPDQNVVLDCIVHAERTRFEINKSKYQFFPDRGRLLAITDNPRGGVLDLITQKMIVANGYFTSTREKGSFVLIYDRGKEEYSIFNKLTGVSKNLTPEAKAFVGDPWHVEFSVSDDGSKLLRAGMIYSRQDTLTATVWDLRQNRILAEYPAHQLGPAVHDKPKVVGMTMISDAAMSVIYTKEIQDVTEVHEAVFSRTGVLDRVLSSIAGHYIRAEVFNEDPDTVSVLTEPMLQISKIERRLKLEQFDKRTGAKKQSITVVLPVGPAAL